MNLFFSSSKENSDSHAKKVLGKKHVIKDFSKCDFTPILEYLKTQKETKAARSKEEKLKEKEEKAAIKEKYGFATVDGV
jgi:DNA topoisomerase-1